MYAGGIPLFLGSTLWLESYAATLLALVPIALLAVRIVLEERFLRCELDGYVAYTQKTRYRLVPFVW
jgi:protein-S-isoprenylcysteine O-methyltransferase Ste14